ncbi:bifunctional methylenetetrahydrofolate dehydrogenase/cyclohydrolase, mitochondrial-like isoform 1-T1 [Acridotheres tristis]
MVPGAVVTLCCCRGDAVVISGRKLARQIRQEARHEVEQWVAAGNRRPHLSVVLVGENPASRSYGLNKTKAAADVGISSETILRPASISEEELLELLGKLNSDAAVDGLLVQLPLPVSSSVPPCCIPRTLPRLAGWGARRGDPAVIVPLSTSCLQGSVSAGHGIHSWLGV